MDDIVHDLARLGFSENESKMYVALLNLGAAKASHIAMRVRVSRGTVYDVLRSLQDLELVKTEKRGSETVYVPEAPARILTIIENRKQELVEQKRSASQLLVRLQAFHNPSERKPKIRYIETIEGLRMMQREYEAMDQDLIQLLGYDSFLQLQQTELSKQHIRGLSQRKKRIRSILFTDKIVSFSQDNIEIVCLPKALASVRGEMTVCGNRVVFFSYTAGLIAVEIQSAPIAETAKATLELAWNEAKRLTQ